MDSSTTATPEAIPGESKQLDIFRWTDPVIDAVGHDPRSEYVECFWLGILGPSTILLFRRLARALEAEPNGIQIDILETAAALGLAGMDRRDRGQSPIVRSLRRSCTFGMSRQDAPSTFLVRTRFPPLTRRQLERLPDPLQRDHRQWVERDARRPAHAEMRERARRLALSLVELGESYDDAERQLHRWKFHPAIAHDAVRWAHNERLGDDSSSGAPDHVVPSLH